MATILNNVWMSTCQPNPLDQADDIARALAFVQAKAPSWGGDPARVLLLGHSAGAHLVSLLAADPRIVTSKGGAPWLGTIVLDSAAYDLVEIMQRKHPRIYDRAFGKDPAFWTDASPYRRLTVAPAPMFLVCSTRRSDACSSCTNICIQGNRTGWEGHRAAGRYEARRAEQRTGSFQRLHHDDRRVHALARPTVIGC